MADLSFYGFTFLSRMSHKYLTPRKHRPVHRNSQYSDLHIHPIITFWQLSYIIIQSVKRIKKMWATIFHSTFENVLIDKYMYIQYWLFTFKCVTVTVYIYSNLGTFTSNFGYVLTFSFGYLLTFHLGTSWLFWAHFDFFVGCVLVVGTSWLAPVRKLSKGDDWMNEHLHNWIKLGERNE